MSNVTDINFNNNDIFSMNRRNIDKIDKETALDLLSNKETVLYKSDLSDNSFFCYDWFG